MGSPKILASGTINIPVSTQYPTSPAINVPTQKYDSYLLIYYNNSGQSLVSISTIVRNYVFPSGSIPTMVEINAKTASFGNNGNAGTQAIVPMNGDVDIFSIGSPIYFQFNLGAVATGGTGILIDYVLYGIRYKN